MELRCGGNKLHGIVVANSSGEIEVRCDSTFCGKKRGVVVLHRFNLSTGAFHTEKYSEPNKERNANASRN